MSLPVLPNSSFSSPLPNGNHQEPRPPSPAAPPYSPITPTMSASLPFTNGASSSTSTYNGNNNRNPYPYAPPPLTSSLASSPDPLQHAHPSYPRQQPPPSNPQQQLQSQQQQHSQSQQQQQQHHQLSYQQQPPYPQSTHIPSLPPPHPISESTNPDAIALRATMSILQIQRQQALRDLTVLEQQKGVALTDPEGFMAAVKDGRVRSREVRGVGLYAGEDDDSDEEEGGGDGGGGGGRGRQKVEMEIPGSQNIVRAPPINWAQYHIVGESLDKLHEEQRRRPVGGEPVGEEELRPKEREGGRERAEVHTIARPYDPFVDRLAGGSGGGGRRGREGGAGGGVSGGSGGRRRG